MISEVAQEAGQLYVLQRTPSFTIPLAQPTGGARSRQQNERSSTPNCGTGSSIPSQVLRWCTLIWRPRHLKAALEVSEEERLAEYENRWASGGLSPYYAFTDSLLSMESNQTLADFARAKIRERVDDPAIAEKLCPDYPILTRRLSPETNYLEAFNQSNVELIDLMSSRSVTSHLTALSWATPKSSSTP